MKEIPKTYAELPEAVRRWMEIPGDLYDSKTPEEKAVWLYGFLMCKAQEQEYKVVGLSLSAETRSWIRLRFCYVTSGRSGTQGYQGYIVCADTPLVGSRWTFATEEEAVEFMDGVLAVVKEKS